MIDLQTLHIRIPKFWEALRNEPNTQPGDYVTFTIANLWRHVGVVVGTHAESGIAQVAYVYRGVGCLEIRFQHITVRPGDGYVEPLVFGDEISDDEAQEVEWLENWLANYAA